MGLRGSGWGHMPGGCDGDNRDGAGISGAIIVWSRKVDVSSPCDPSWPSIPLHRMGGREVRFGLPPFPGLARHHQGPQWASLPRRMRKYSAGKPGTAAITRTRRAIQRTEKVG
jgi:hypothetical protein